MKTLLTSLLLMLSVAASTAATETPTNSTPWSATVSCNSNGHKVHPGQEIGVRITISNVSTNIRILSLKSWALMTWEVEPHMTRVATTNTLSGTTSRSFYLAQGSSAVELGKGRGGWIHNATEYAFVKPGEAIRCSSTVKIPDLPEGVPIPANTTYSYSGVIHADDDGSSFSLNAWTGKISIASFSKPLQHKPSTEPKKESTTFSPP